MKLSKLYSNRPEIFEPIVFNSGLNVVLADIRLPENKKKDSHNLGKSTLGSLINFCLLMQKSSAFFLFKHIELFNDLVFYIELELLDGTFLTVKRGVEEATKISFKKHTTPKQDFSNLPNDSWDHYQLAFDPAKNLLDSLLDLQALNPWGFRKEIGYLLRTQDDYRDVFHLKKFGGAHSDWKPFLAHLLGFDSYLIERHYDIEKKLENEKEKVNIIKSELGGSVEDISKIEGILLLKKDEADKKQALVDSFDFRSQDKEKTNQLVEEINEQIAQLNNERYSLNQNRKKILSSLEEDKIRFNTEEAAKLFKEAGILFEGQIKKDYEQLIAFNKAITEERQQFLLEELKHHEDGLKKINAELDDLGKRRSESLSFISETDVVKKYKYFTNEISILKADIATLERQRSHIQKLQALRSQIRNLEEQKNHLQAEIENNVEIQNSDSKSFFSRVRLYFSEIVEEVIDRKALLSVSPNKEGHLEFKAQILDKSGNDTSADMGHTYRKLLCVAFDLAVLRAHLPNKFPRFLYHDGIFESLDPRKKSSLLNVIRKYNELGIQHIITLLNSELPPQEGTENPMIHRDEIILLLHDENEKGRLFKIKAW